MGFFKSKPQVKQQSTSEEAMALAREAENEQYREELRGIGRQRFRELIDASAVDLKKDIDQAMHQATTDLKEYMTRQLDVTIAKVNSDIVGQLNERLKDYNRITGEAQDLASQSLNRNSQEVYEKYQQFSASMQQVIASQEVAMISVFQENKTKITEVQHEQQQILQSMQEAARQSQLQVSELSVSMQKNVSDQASILSEVYHDNITRLSSIKDAQSNSINTLSSTTNLLEQQYQQLSALLNKTVADQKAMVADLINNNMARIVEHYLVGALGEQSDLKTQIPSILQRMEENKQAMMEDMTL